MPNLAVREHLAANKPAIMETDVSLAGHRFYFKDTQEIWVYDKFGVPKLYGTGKGGASGNFVKNGEPNETLDIQNADGQTVLSVSEENPFDDYFTGNLRLAARDITAFKVDVESKQAESQNVTITLNNDTEQSGQGQILSAARGYYADSESGVTSYNNSLDMYIDGGQILRAGNYWDTQGNSNKYFELCSIQGGHPLIKLSDSNVSFNNLRVKDVAEGSEDNDAVNMYQFNTGVSGANGNIKRYAPDAAVITIPTTAWVANTTYAAIGCSYRASFALPTNNGSTTDTDAVNIAICGMDLPIANDAGVMPFTEIVANNTVYIYAQSIPTANLRGTYFIIRKNRMS